MAKLPTFNPAIVNGNCPNCGPDKRANVVGQADRQWDEANGYISFHETHRLLSCPACETVYHQIESSNSEDVYSSGPEEYEGDEPVVTIRHWHESGKIVRGEPSWINDLGRTDAQLKELLQDSYDALNVGLNVLSVVGLRIVIDKATEILEIDPLLSFENKLNELEKMGYVGRSDHEKLKIAVDAGNAAAHRGWKPSVVDLSFVFETLESFLHRIFILPQKAKAVKAAIPPRQKRVKTTP